MSKVVEWGVLERRNSCRFAPTFKWQEMPLDFLSQTPEASSGMYSLKKKNYLIKEQNIMEQRISITKDNRPNRTKPWLVRWCELNGGYCDCEVVMNVVVKKHLLG